MARSLGKAKAKAAEKEKAKAKAKDEGKAKAVVEADVVAEAVADAACAFDGFDRLFSGSDDPEDRPARPLGCAFLAAGWFRGRGRRRRDASAIAWKWLRKIRRFYVWSRFESF